LWLAELQKQILCLVPLVLTLICYSCSSLFLLKFVLTVVVILANRLQFVVLSYIYLLSSILLASRVCQESRDEAAQELGSWGVLHSLVM
jgi:hypothetical protein